MIPVLRTIDAHVGGQPIRLITDGLSRITGATMPARRERLKRQDAVRRALVLPPRGHVDLTAVLFTEAAAPGSHAGLLAMDADGFPALNGNGVIAAVTIALERGLWSSAETSGHLVIDTPAGTIHAQAHLVARQDAQRVDSVTLTSVPAFVHAPAYPVRLGTRELRVDIAFGGAFHAILDTDAIGIPLTARRLPELRRLALDVLDVLKRDASIVHPSEPTLAGIDAVTFTGPPNDPEAHLRNVTVTRGGGVDRSAGVGATSAVMAVLDAMGLLPDAAPFIHEGLNGAVLRGQPLRRTVVGECPAVVTDVTGSAWITGEHAFVIDEDDPFRDGIAL